MDVDDAVFFLAEAGMVTVDVTVLVDAGSELPADTTGVATIDVASLVDAGKVTVGVADLAVAGAASLADAEMVFPADLAEKITVGLAGLVVAGAVSRPMLEKCFWSFLLRESPWT